MSVDRTSFIYIMNRIESVRHTLDQIVLNMVGGSDHGGPFNEIQKLFFAPFAIGGTSPAPYQKLTDCVSIGFENGDEGQVLLEQRPRQDFSTVSDDYKYSLTINTLPSFRGNWLTLEYDIQNDPPEHTYYLTWRGMASADCAVSIVVRSPKDDGPRIDQRIGALILRKDMQILSEPVTLPANTVKGSQIIFFFPPTSNQNIVIDFIICSKVFN